MFATNSYSFLFTRPFWINLFLFQNFFEFFLSIARGGRRLRHIHRKLGLVSKEKDDDGLFESLFATMADTSADFTGVFRELSKACFSFSRFRIIRFRVKGSMFSKSMAATHDRTELLCRITIPHIAP